MKPKQVRILATYADGGVAVIAFVTVGYNPDGSVQFKREATQSLVDAECARISEVLPSAIVSWRFIADADVPTSRDYRGAWVDTGTSIGHDMTRARALHREKLRAERAPLLAALDVEYQRADERSDAAEKRRVALAKQALRDVTSDPRIEAAANVDELRAVRIGSQPQNGGNKST